MVLEAFAFKEGYPDEASRAALTMWGRDPGIRMMAGQPIAVETVGGFAVWDAGLYLTLILGAWALTTATRVLRGDEEHGRSDLLLAGPIRSGRALAAQFLVLFGGCVLVGAAVGLGLAGSGAQVWGSVLFGALMIGYCATLVGLAGLACQVFATRVGALGVSASVLVGWMLLRMVSNSMDSRAWLGWLTPTGWIDQLRAFGENRWWVLLVPLVVAAVLMAAAVGLRERRDSGAGLLAGRSGHRSRSWGLGSPLGFAWRAHLGVLLAWGAGVAIAALVVGAMLRTVDDFLATDQGFIDILAQMGMEVSDLTGGFVSMWAIILGLVIAVFSAFRMGATRAEEASTRAEFLLTRPVRRWRWLGGHVLCLVASVLLLSAVAATALWLGGVATDAPLDRRGRVRGHLQRGSHGDGVRRAVGPGVRGRPPADRRRGGLGRRRGLRPAAGRSDAGLARVGGRTVAVPPPRGGPGRPLRADRRDRDGGPRAGAGRWGHRRVRAS